MKLDKNAALGAIIACLVVICIHIVFNAAGYAWTAGRIQAMRKAERHDVS